jgi:hypothetical protein
MTFVLAGAGLCAACGSRAQVVGDAGPTALDPAAVPAADASPEQDAAAPGLLAVAVGGNGEILELNGEAWSQVARTGSELTTAAVLPNGEAFAAGVNAYWQRSPAGQWRPGQSPGGANVVYVWGNGRDLVMARTRNSGVYRYQGGSWSRIEHDFGSVSLGGMAFLSVNDGVLVGTKTDASPMGGIVYRYQNGAISIIRQDLDRGLSVVGLAQDGQMAIGGYSDYLAGDPLNFKTWDGETWSTVETKEWRRHVTAIDCRHAGFCLAVTDGGGTQQSASGSLLLHKTAPAAPWTVWGDLHSLGAGGGALYGGCVINSKLIVAVGPGPKLLRYDGSTWTAIDGAHFPGLVTLHGLGCLVQ